MSKLALKFPGEELVSEKSLGEFGSQTFDFKFYGNTPTYIINRLIPYILIFAGTILFVMLIAGGFSIFVSAGNPEKVKKGQGMIVNALIGFFIIFSSYWIIQLLEFSLGISIL